jgi:hypothetical protein
VAKEQLKRCNILSENGERSDILKNYSIALGILSRGENKKIPKTIRELNQIRAKCRSMVKYRSSASAATAVVP